MKPALVLALLLVAAPAHSQDLGAFEKILFPVLTGLPLRGANGTLFQTSLRASAAEEVTFYAGEFAVQRAGIDFVHGVEGGPRLLYFERGKAISFFYELTVTGPDGSTHTTTLPAVRERQFQNGTTVILGLRTMPKLDPTEFPPRTTIGYAARNRVRVYDVDNTGALSVRIRVTVPALEAFGAFAQFELPVTTRAGDDPSHPFYAEVAIPDLCITAPHGVTCRDYRLYVAVEPTNPTLRYWAFATATNNATGETSVFFAQ